MIASQATEDKNHLRSGTLGWRAIKNYAEYESEQISGSISNSGGSLSGSSHEDSASGTTWSAVSGGSVEITDTAGQEQDIAGLSRDVENANGSINPIFNKAKEQQRLQQVRLIGEMGSQIAGIIRTQGMLSGMQAQNDPQALAQAEAELKASDKPVTQEAIKQRAWENAQKQYGTGSDYQKAAQAITAVLQGVAGGDIGAALAGGANPYVAQMIKAQTGENSAANAMAHAVWGALGTALAGGNALAGGAGALTGELVASQIVNALYPGREVSELTESEKRTVSALSTLASGLAGGLSSGSTAGVAVGVQAGQNAVDNNSLSEAADYLVSGKTQTEKFEEAQKQIEKATEEFKTQYCSGLSAAACTEKQNEMGWENIKGATGLGLGFVPVVGDIKSFAEAESALDYLAATIGLIPVLGDVAEASRLINKASDDITSANYFGQERKYWSADSVNVKGNKVYQRNDLFDPNAVDSRGRTNIQRMEKELAPLDANGQSINLHHMLQKQDGPIAEVT